MKIHLSIRGRCPLTKINEFRKVEVMKKGMFTTKKRLCLKKKCELLEFLMELHQKYDETKSNELRRCKSLASQVNYALHWVELS